MNIYVDNVLIFNEVIDSKDKLGQKTLQYRKMDNNSLLQMMGRIGRFKPGRAVIISDTPIPKKINPMPVRKALETETPFDLVLLMSKYGLKLSELEFMSKVDHTRSRLRGGLARWTSEPSTAAAHEINLEGAPDERDPLRAGLRAHDLQRPDLRATTRWPGSS